MKNTSNKINQRGSALLLTLGILSLVLIMAMSFAFSARTSRQVAKVNADQVKARLLAESALERVLAAMKNAYQDTSTPPVSIPYPPQTTGLSSMSFASSGGQGYIFSSDGSTSREADDEEDDLLEQIPFGSSVSDEIYFLPMLGRITPAASPAILPTFHKVCIDKNNDGDTNDPDEAIGRIAFLVIEEANKLDVNQMLSLNNKVPFVQSGQERVAPLSIDYTAADFLYNILGDGSTTMTLSTSYEGDTVRLGLNMQELQLLPYQYYTFLPNGYNGYTGTKAQWFSYAHLWKSGMWGASGASPGDELIYTFFSGEDIEAYWDDSDADPANWVARHRFDISGTEWGGWEHTDLAAAQAIVTALTAAGSSPAIPDPANLTGNATGIPYLQTLGTGQQVAANMVDFCDSDSYATTDATWDGSSQPNYSGNERVSYINELHLAVCAYRVPDSGTPAKHYFQVKLQPSFEFVNIYNEAVPSGKVRFRFLGRIEANEFRCTDSTVPAVTYSNSAVISIDKSIDFDLAAQSTLGYVTYGSSLDGAVTYPLPSLDEKTVVVQPIDAVGAPVYISADTASIKVFIDKIVISSGEQLDNNEKIYDVAFWGSDPTSPTPPSVTLIVDDDSGDSLYLNLKVNDPRCNHLSDSWTPSVPVASSAHTLSADNLSFPEPNDGSVDYEQSVSFESPSLVTFSTAFIPNRPFRSLWELGAIHRGEPFRTLDIAGADSAILDQVKIGPLKRTRGKFNSNSRNDAAFAKLFENIDILRHYDGVASDEQTAAGAILVSPSLTSAPSFSRANISPGLLTDAYAAAAAMPTPVTFLNDRQREALIGRTANLLTTRVDKYSVLVVGQALKDLAGAGITSTNWDDVKKTVINPTEYDGGYYSLLGTQRILAHIVRDAWRNEYKVVQMQLLED